MVRLKISPGIGSIPTATIPDDPQQFPGWFKDVFLPRWASNADVRNAVPGTGISISGNLSTPATISVDNEVSALFAQPYVLIGAPVAPAVLTDYRSLAAQLNVLTLNDSGPELALTVGVALNGIGNAQLRQSAAASVIGNATSALANVADIVSTLDNTVLNRQSGALVFSALPVGALAAIANNTLIGNVSGSSAAPAALNQTQLTTLLDPITPTWTGNHTFAATSGVSVTVDAATGNLAAQFVGTGATDTFAIDCASGRFTTFLVKNAGTLKAQFAWDNTLNVASITTNSASASLQFQSGNGASAMFFDANGVKFEIQPNPSAVNATATLTIAQLLTGIITSTTAAAVTGTLPTGTLTDAGIVAGAAGAGLVNGAFSWSVIATGANAFTVAAGVGHTLVGSGTVASGASGRFLTRKTAANTFVTYRLS